MKTWPAVAAMLLAATLTGCSPAAVESLLNTPTPTVAVSAAPTASPPPPTTAVTPSPTPVPTVGVTASPPPASATAPAMSQAEVAAGMYSRSCIRVRHTGWEGFVSYFDWAMDLFAYFGVDPVTEIDYILVTVADTNDGEPVELTYDPIFGFWGGRFGLDSPGEKLILSVEIHWSDGTVTDMTEIVVEDLGDFIDVGYPEENEAGDCKGVPEPEA